MSSFAGRRMGRAGTIAVMAVTLLGATVGSAFAEDSMQSFFSTVFGGAPAQPLYAPQPEVQVDLPRRSYSRPLTVKLRRPKVATFQAPPTKPGKVSIFEDKTLRRGDAVMTRHGMRIFAGSSNWPYRDGDFVAIADAGRMDKGVQKTLVSLDSLPRN